MNSGIWNPWKIAAIGMALVTATALIVGVVVASWYGPPRKTGTATAQGLAPHPAGLAQSAPSSPSMTHVASTSLPTAVDECNRHAARYAGQRPEAIDTVKDAGVGALLGAAVGAAGGAIAGGGRGAGKAAAIGGLVGAGGGTVYGLNESQKYDHAYRAAYSSCMSSHGYN
ncbi:MAG: hypothetical protein HY216_03395 [Candidatus Rokubacteria bacterium]|nr:hypothetical protein [Candidatus Rokubacteria bacterium]